MVNTVRSLAGREPSLPRSAVAGAAVVATLLAAVLAARAGSTSGLTLVVATLANTATDALQRTGEVIPLGVAFGLGMAAAVNPCGCALLPAYLALYLGTAAGQPRPWPHQVARALLVSAAMSASVVALFAAAGLVLGALGAAAADWLPWLSLSTGVLLAILGGRLLAGGAVTAVAAARNSLLAYAAYGLAFALSSLGCTLPLLLAAVGTGVARGGLLGGLGQLVLYGLGMSVVVALLTVLFGLFGGGVLARVRGAAGRLQPLSGALVLATGGYIVYYWLSAGGILE